MESMKDRIIQAMVRDGIAAEKASDYYETFITEVCDGHTPTMEGLAKLDADDVRRVFKPFPAKAILGAIGTICSVGVRLVYEAGRKYTAAEYTALYVTDRDNEQLLRALRQVSRGRSWVVATEGVVHEPQSAQFLTWHMNDDPAPATVLVNSVPVAPVQPGEERTARLYVVDPFTPGDFLDVEMTSRRTGASFQDYSDEAISAMSFLFVRELRNEGMLTLRLLAHDMRTKSPAEILKTFPETYAAWNRLTPHERPAARRARATPDERPNEDPGGSREPPWLDKVPFPEDDPNALRFLDALCDAYPVTSPNIVRPICGRAGIATSRIALTGTSYSVWSAVLKAAVAQTRMRDLFAVVLEDDQVAAHFTEWRH